MSAATTLAPSRTKTFTDAFAIPDPAPVMTATLPSSSPIERPPLQLGVSRSQIFAPRV